MDVLAFALLIPLAGFLAAALIVVLQRRGR